MGWYLSVIISRLRYKLNNTQTGFKPGMNMEIYQNLGNNTWTGFKPGTWGWIWEDTRRMVKIISIGSYEKNIKIWEGYIGWYDNSQFLSRSNLIHLIGRSCATILVIGTETLEKLSIESNGVDIFPNPFSTYPYLATV